MGSVLVLLMYAALDGARRLGEGRNPVYEPP
jgi:hypothetical protein